ncbi:adenylate/guanylate cyclase domain-containing protein [Rhizobium leguminosarum]|uniref:adenylate/guanylate cyclase domain-containing protein n=2 Tax=Rhizobium leguminosarum TaxID=384 RepID=UPI0021BC070E|nr:adenylate/guanylate cyclase domain-containing protein [Rhizobium leguminosarum]
MRILKGGAMATFLSGEPEKHGIFLDAEIEAERTLAFLRILSAFILSIPHFSALSLSPTDRAFGVQLPSMLALATFFLTGTFALFLIRYGQFRLWMRYVFAVVDAIMVASVCYLSLKLNSLSGAWLFAAPVIWSMPLLLTVGALRYRPAIQIWSTLLFVFALAFVFISLSPVSNNQFTSSPGVQRLFSLLPSVSRLCLIMLTGLASIVVMYRARSLLIRAEEQAYATAALARFLPPEIVPLVAKGDEWIHGRRQVVTVLFVDIRNSTQIAEGLDPKALSHLISSFRRIVQQAAKENGGVIDKFIGDGAMILFGVPDPTTDDARRGLNCGRDILRLIAEWHIDSLASHQLTVGLGVHRGKVYCGIVGDENRREFTVIGDAVNVASRIEQATKQFGIPFLASREVVIAANEDNRWNLISSEPLRGKQNSVSLMAPKI